MNAREQTLISVCQKAITDGDRGLYTCPDSVITMDGMSSKKCRCFLNSIGRNFIKYIEVGTWKGSTLFSAANPMMNELVSIDNWSEFNGPKADFQANCELYKDLLPANFKVIEKDFREVTELKLDNYDCLFYDGNHTEQSQRDAICYLNKFMTGSFIYMVDDYAWPEVKAGTQRGIKDAGLEVVWEHELQSKTFNDPDNYWNGILVSVLRKPHVSEVG